MWKLLFAILVVTLASYTSAIDDELTVKVKNGLLRGKFVTTRKGREIRAFLGIPYAKPPVGNLRFQPPQPAENWNGIREANEDHAVCIQNDFVTRGVLGVEDCLFLNVYAPKTKDAQNLPVMVWIHGGAYFGGSGSPKYYGPKILLDRDIILVSINYRLGALGFLSTGDKVVPGNNGLKDQVLALKWVKKNIKHFGGNPNSVTIFGESAGAGSTHLLSLSKTTKGLVHGAIVQSGSAFCQWSMQTPEDGRELSTKLAALFDCPTDDSKSMVECLVKVSAEDITKARKHFEKWHVHPYVVFRPIIEVQHEGAFLTDTPLGTIKSGDANDIPIMIGVVKDEGLLMTAPFFADNTQLIDLEQNFDRYVSTILCFNDNKFETIAPKVRQFYFGKQKLQEVDRQSLTDLFTDGAFVHCEPKAIAAHVKYHKQPIYSYQLAHQGAQSFVVNLGLKDGKWGVSHVDDLQYLFDMKEYQLDHPFNGEDGNVSEFFVERWTNFAKYGSPNHPDSDDVKWKPVSTDNVEYMYIGGPSNYVMKDNLNKERMDFWKGITLPDIKYTPKDEL